MNQIVRPLSFDMPRVSTLMGEDWDGLAERMAGEIEGMSRVIRFCNPLRSPLTVERMLIQAGEVPGGPLDVDEAVAAMMELCRAGADERGVVVVVEQAETLSLEAVAALARVLETADGLRLILAGKPALEGLLAAAQAAPIRAAMGGEHRGSAAMMGSVAGWMGDLLPGAVPFPVGPAVPAPVATTVAFPVAPAIPFADVPAVPFPVAWAVTAEARVEAGPPMAGLPALVRGEPATPSTALPREVSVPELLEALKKRAQSLDDGTGRGSTRPGWVRPPPLTAGEQRSMEAALLPAGPRLTLAKVASRLCLMFAVGGCVASVGVYGLAMLKF